MGEVTDQSKAVLFLSYPYPPAVSAGVFRAARFVKFLPEFSWRPLVFTVETDEHFPMDTALANYVPGDTFVESAPLWQPDLWPSKFFGRKNVAQAEKAPNSKADRPEIIHVNQNPGDPRYLGLRDRLKTIRQRVLSTPDPKIWWAIPSFLKALRLVRKHRPQVIFSTTPPHSSHLLGTWIKRWTGLPLVLDFRDPWARTPWIAGDKNTYIEKVNARLEKKCIKAADAVILNTRRTQKEFEDFYGANYRGKFHTIYNGFDPSLLAKCESMQNQQLNAKKSLKLCHVGTIYGRREIRPLLRALRKLVDANRPVEFEQVGRVKVDYDLAAVIREHRLENHVRICPPVSHHEALQRMADADSLVLIQPDSTLQVPGKLFEMMMFRKPIFSLTGDGETCDIVGRYRLGPVADPFDETQIASALERLMDQIRLGQDSPEAADWEKVKDDFDGKTQTRYLADILNHVSESQSN